MSIYLYFATLPSLRGDQNGDCEMKLRATLAAVAVAALAVSGCTTVEQTTAGGAIAGAGVAAATGGNVVAGAAIGAGTGLVIGTLANGNCRYRNPDGSTYIAKCP